MAEAEPRQVDTEQHSHARVGDSRLQRVIGTGTQALKRNRAKTFVRDKIHGSGEIRPAIDGKGMRQPIRVICRVKAVPKAGEIDPE